MFHESHNEISMGGEGEIHECIFENLKDFFFFPSSLYLTACEESNCSLLDRRIWGTACHSFLKLFRCPQRLQQSPYTLHNPLSSGGFRKCVASGTAWLLVETVMKGQSYSLSLDPLASPCFLQTMVLATGWDKRRSLAPLARHCLGEAVSILNGRGGVPALQISGICFSHSSKGQFQCSKRASQYFCIYFHLFSSIQTCFFRNKAVELPSHVIYTGVSSDEVYRHYIGVSEDRDQKPSFLAQDPKQSIL